MSASKAGSQGDTHGPVEHLLLHDHVWATRVAITLWTVAGLLFVAMAVPPLRDAIGAFDERIYDATYPIKWAPITVAAHTLAFLGSAVFVWPLRVVVAWYLAAQRRWPGFWVWVAAIVVSEPLIGILKAAYGRARPPVALVVSTSGAFPSGHAVAGSVVAISLVVVFVQAGPARRNMEMLAALFALVMAGSRIYLGAHWFTDVAAGLALGAACSVGAAAAVSRIYEKRPGAGQAEPGMGASGP